MSTSWPQKQPRTHQNSTDCPNPPSPRELTRIESGTPECATSPTAHNPQRPGSYRSGLAPVLHTLPQPNRAPNASE